MVVIIDPFPRWRPAGPGGVPVCDGTGLLAVQWAGEADDPAALPTLAAAADMALLPPGEQDLAELAARLPPGSAPVALPASAVLGPWPGAYADTAPAAGSRR
jgi:hypothetical protein